MVTARSPLAGVKSVSQGVESVRVFVKLSLLGLSDPLVDLYLNLCTIHSFRAEDTLALVIAVNGQKTSCAIKASIKAPHFDVVVKDSWVGAADASDYSDIFSLVKLDAVPRHDFTDISHRYKAVGEPFVVVTL